MGLGSLAAETASVVALLLVSGLPLTVAWVTTFLGRGKLSSGRAKSQERETKRALVLVRVNESAEERWRERLRSDRDSGQFDRMIVIAGEAMDLPSTETTHVICKHVPLEDTLPSNRKIARLRLAELELASIGPATLVVGDADVELAAPFLEDARTLERGMLWSPPIGGTDDAIGRALLSSTLQSFMAISALTKATRSPPAMAGKAFAISSEALVAVGGFGAFGSYIGEDIAMSEALHRFQIKGSPSSPSLIDPQPWAVWVQRCTRWMQVLRAHRPVSYWSYPALMTPLVWMIPVTIGLGGACWIALLYYALVRLWMVLALCRVSLVARAGRANVPEHSGVLVTFLWGLLGDGLLVIAWLRALGGRGIRWQGRQYRLGRGGSIEAVSVLASDA